MITKTSTIIGLKKPHNNFSSYKSLETTSNFLAHVEGNFKTNSTYLESWGKSHKYFSSYQTNKKPPKIKLLHGSRKKSTNISFPTHPVAKTHKHLIFHFPIGLKTNPQKSNCIDDILARCWHSFSQTNLEILNITLIFYNCSSLFRTLGFKNCIGRNFDDIEDK